MENIMHSYTLLQEWAPVAKKLDYGTFGSLWAMMLEEWAKAHNEDVVEIVDNLAELVKLVNADLGPY